MELAATIERIKAAVGPRGCITNPRDMEPYLVEARGLYRGATQLVVRPGSTEEVAAVVRICAEAKLPMVPQGGNTGLVGGGVPPENWHNIVLASPRRPSSSFPSRAKSRLRSLAFKGSEM